MKPGQINPAYKNMEITGENFPRYKAGANYSDKSKIKKYTEMGYQPDQIAHMLGIVLTCVEAHIKPPRKKPGPKPRVIDNE